MGTVVSAPAPLSSPLWLLYSCLFWTVLFFLSRANRNIQTVSFFITSNPVSLCHQSPSPSRKVFDSQSSKSFVWEEKKVKNVISCSEKWRGGDPKYGLNEQMWSQHTFRAAEKYKQEREKKKKIYDKFMLWHQRKPLQCEVFPLRKALMLPSSLDSGYFT